MGRWRHAACGSRGLRWGWGWGVRLKNKHERGSVGPTVGLRTVAWGEAGPGSGGGMGRGGLAREGCGSTVLGRPTGLELLPDRQPRVEARCRPGGGMEQGRVNYAYPANVV